MSLFLASALAICSCGGRPSFAPPVPPSSADVLARVNGVELRAADAEALLRQGDHTRSNPTAKGEIPHAVLETLVRDELRAQRAIALGLDRDPKFQAERQEKETALAAWRRASLADLLMASQAAGAKEISDEEARAYFRDHKAQLSTETHVMQVLVRDRARIDAIATSLQSGRAFGEVAAEQFPGLPDTMKKPWDLGYLKWAQLPEPWKPAIDAIPIGGTSGVIEGSGNRYWILHVVDRRSDPSLDFDRARADVLHLLALNRESNAVGELDQQLLENARVEFAQ